MSKVPTEPRVIKKPTQNLIMIKDAPRLHACCTAVTLYVLGNNLEMFFAARKKIVEVTLSVEVTFTH